MERGEASGGREEKVEEDEGLGWVEGLGDLDLPVSEKKREMPRCSPSSSFDLFSP
jgi:hypothetical protein